jgi:putative ABC transport system permease protein
MASGSILDSIRQDIRHGLRSLRQHPAFSVIAITTLALGIGANTAIFSILNAALLRSLPFRDPARLVIITETHPRAPEIGVSIPDYNDWREKSKSFSGFGAYASAATFTPALTGRGDPVQITGAIVTHDLFPVLGIAPSFGRNFTAEEDQDGKGPVVILSGELWKSRFGADPGILGRTINLDGQPFAVVGVFPPGVRFPQFADVFVPLGNLPGGPPERTTRVHHPLFAVARIKTGVTRAQATAELTAIAAHLQQQYPDTNHGFGVKVESLQEKYLSGIRRTLMVLWAAVALVLLIACANVASLLLAQAGRRESELAVRITLGASPARVLRQLLTENMLLGFCGGGLGVALAWVSLPPLAEWIPRFFDAPVLKLHEIKLDLRVLLGAVAVTVISGILFGILPAWHASHRAPVTSLRGGGRTPGAASRRAQRILVAAEVTLAVIVLSAAGLLARTVKELLNTSPGFRSDHLVTMRISLPATKYTDPNGNDVLNFYTRLFEHLKSMPGIENAGSIDQTPLVSNYQMTRFLVEGQPAARPGDFPVAHMRFISPAYFQTMGIPLIKGREFDANDVTRTDNGVLLINETLARQYFPDQDPIGHNLMLGVMTPKPTPTPIIGIVGDTRDLSIDSPAPAEMYFAGFNLTETLVVRFSNDPAEAAVMVRHAVQDIDPTQPIYQVKTSEQLIGESMSRQKFSAAILCAFSFLALLLAAGGIYGVTSYVVGQRTQEVGLRMALGAQPADVTRFILSQELLAPALGLLIGLAGAFAADRLLANLLYRISPSDPFTHFAVAALLAFVALLACFIPTLAALRIDPMTALRHE